MAFSHKLGITDSHGYIFVICHAPPSTTTGQKPLVLFLVFLFIYDCTMLQVEFPI